LVTDTHKKKLAEKHSTVKSQQAKELNIKKNTKLVPLPLTEQKTSCIKL